MYKTVRHGENSLQYTILPQQDDGLSGQRKTRRRGRFPLLLVVTLILAGGAVAAAVVVPLFVTTDLVKLPEALQRLTGKTYHAGTHSSIREPLHPKHEATTSGHPSDANTNSATMFLDKLKGNLEMFSKSQETTPQKQTKPAEFTTEITSTTTTVAPTTTEKVTVEVTEQPTTQPPLLQTTQDDQQFITSDVNVFRITIESSNNTSHEVVVTTISPLTSSSGMTDGTTTTKTTWFGTHWVLSDPSSYLQWTGYSGRDSLLLPIALGCILLLLLVSVGACYLVRRRRQKKLRRKTIGEISTDLQQDDKATLLPDGSEEE